MYSRSGARAHCPPDSDSSSGSDSSSSSNSAPEPKSKSKPGVVCVLNTHITLTFLTLSSFKGTSGKNLPLPRTLIDRFKGSSEDDDSSDTSSEEEVLKSKPSKQTADGIISSSMHFFWLSF